MATINATGFPILDEDNMASDSDTALATQQSIKAYVDNQISSSGGLQSVQVFTSSGTWTKPAGINKVRVIVVGAGGGGGGCNATGSSGVNESGGGGGGGASIKLIDVTSTSSESVTVGSGGSGGAAGTNNGSNGGTSSFGSLCSATGGNGGEGGAATINIMFSNGGSGGSGTGGSYNIDGGDGCNGLCRSGLVMGQGHGGTSFYAGQARMQSSSGTKNAGKSYGGGGAGILLGNSQSASAGSDGADGIVVVYEYS